MIKKFLNEWKEFSNENNILIYQMGKVGSTTLEETIPKSIHLHSLYANWPCSVFFEQRRKGILKRLKGSLSDLLRRIAIKRRDKIKIITIVRDVYSRNVSMYFQNLQHWLYKYAEDYRYDNRFENIENLYDAFDKVFDHNYALSWFDKEIKRFTNIDIYNYSFDKNAGCTRIQNDKYDILIIKLEHMEDNWKVIEEFVGKEIKLINANVSTNKWYHGVYRDFIKSYRPSQNYLELLYTSKLMKHFYTDEDIMVFNNKALNIKNQ